jgi:hypothetical protein
MHNVCVLVYKFFFVIVHCCEWQIGLDNMVECMLIGVPGS